MAGLHFSKSPSFRPSRTPEIKLISTDPTLLPNCLLKPLSIKHWDTHLLKFHSFIYSPIVTPSVSLSKNRNFPTKPTEFHPKISNNSSIHFWRRPKNFQVNAHISPATSQVLAQIFKLGPSSDIVTYTTFIKFLGDSGCSSEAFELFSFMKQKHKPDIISVTVLLRILCNSKMVDQALNLFHKIPYYQLKPDIYCYNTLIDKLVEVGDEECVRKMWSKMQSEGINPDVVSYSSLVKSLCVTKRIDEALTILEFMEISRVIKPNTYVYNTFIKSCLDHGRIKEALGILGRMQIHGLKPDLCSLNLFIKYYSDLGEGMEAYVILKLMIRIGIEASESSYRTCMHGLIKQGKISEVIDLIEETRISGITFSIFTWNKLIMWLGKMGRSDEAYEVFLRLESPDEITMNIVIDLLYKHGKGDEAWKAFGLMKEKKIEASIVTYNILIHGLSKEGRVMEAIEFANQIEEEGKILLDVVTHNCLLAGLCNAGQVDDACRLVLEMVKKRCTPDLISYNTLINGLIRVGRMDDASMLFEHMRGKLAARLMPLEELVEQMLI